MGKPETLATRRGNQEWANQRHWQHEGAIKNGQARDTGNTKGQSRMGKPETLATRRAIKNGQARDTGNIGHTRHKTKKNKTQKHTTKKMS